MSGIPNRAMFYWSGGPLSWMRFNTLWSFRKLHPEWEMRLFVGDLARTVPPAQRWQEKQDWMEPGITRDYLPNVRDLNVSIEPWHCPAGYPNATPVHENDLCRWGALSQFGGWFFDLDILFVDKLESLAKEVGDADVALIPARDWIPTGFIGAAANNSFTGACYSAALQAPDKARYRAAGSETIARVLGIEGADGWYRHSRNQLSASIRRAFPGLRWGLLSQIVAYRWEWFDANQIFAANDGVFQQTVAIHWYASARVAQRMMRKLGEQNYRETANTYTSFVSDLAGADVFV